MTNPFDVTDLITKFKGQGLEIAEQGAKIATRAILAWMKESVLLTDNKWDDFFIVVEPMIETELLKLADKINPVAPV